MARADIVRLLALDSVPVQLGGRSGVFEGYHGDLSKSSMLKEQ